MVIIAVNLVFGGSTRQQKPWFVAECVKSWRRGGGGGLWKRWRNEWTNLNAGTCGNRRV